MSLCCVIHISMKLYGCTSRNYTRSKKYYRQEGRNYLDNTLFKEEEELSGSLDHVLKLNSRFSYK
jgi:hypothetical protein